MTTVDFVESHASVAPPRPIAGTRREVLLVLGLVSSFLYVTMNIVSTLVWREYSSTSQTVSELSAIGAPTRAIWLPMAFLYTALVTAFGWGVRQAAGESRALRTVGGLLMVYGLLGLIWPFAPMHLRPALAAGGGTLSDTIHITLGVVTVLLMLAAIGFGAGAFGRRFRVYSIATLIRVVRLRRSHGTRGAGDQLQSAHAPDRRLGANQHRRVPALGHGAVLHASHRADAICFSPGLICHLEREGAGILLIHDRSALGRRRPRPRSLSLNAE